MSSQIQLTADADVAQVLQNTQTIAMVGASANPDRPSHDVMRYLLDAGYTVIPVSPNCIDQEIHGQKVYCSLADIPGQIDLVDVFRRVDAIPSVVDQILPLVADKSIRVLWLQLGLVDEESALRASEAGLAVVMDRCMKIEHQRLLG